MLFLVIMFACVYFKKDGTLSVVHKNDKDLKVLTDFETREQVEMFNMEKARKTDRSFRRSHSQSRR